MTNDEITRKFLLLLAESWDDPSVHHGFTELREQVLGQGEWARIIEARLLVQESKIAEAIALLDEVLGRDSTDYAASLMLVCILNKAVRNFPKALDLLNDILSRGFEGQLLPEWFEALALNEKAYALYYENIEGEALETVDRLQDRFGGVQEPILAGQVARGLVCKGVILGQQGKLEEASRCYEEVARRFGEATAPCLQEPVARALLNMGVVLGQQGKPEEEIRSYEEVERRFGKATAPGLQGPVATALVYKGITLGKQGKPEEEIRVYEEVERRFGQATAPDLQEQVAMALLNKGLVLGRQGKPEEEIQSYEEVERRFGQAMVPRLQEQVARALLTKGLVLGQQGKPEEAIRSFEEVERRFGQSTASGLQKQVARALVGRGITLRQQGKLEEEIRVYEEVERRFGQAMAPGLQRQVAMALVNKGVVLGRQGKPEEEIRAYEEVERRFGQATVSSLQEQVAMALVNKGVVLGQQGKPEEEIWFYEEVERRFGQATASGLQEQVAMALVFKGITYGQQGKPEEEMRVYEEVDHRFGQTTAPGLQEQVAGALVSKGIALGLQGMPEEEMRVYEEVERRFGEATAPGLQEQVVRALMYKGWTLEDAEKWSDAVCAYDNAIIFLRKAATPSLLKWSFDAQLRKSLVLLKMGQTMEARELFESIQKVLLKNRQIKKEISSLYTRVARRFRSAMPPGDASQRKRLRTRDLQITKDDLQSHLETILYHVLEEIKPETQGKYFDKIKVAENRTNKFITDPALFTDDFSFLLILREWNSYTPVIPSAEESDRGGGYYIRHAGQGIVIDPGYDFIENFHHAGGRLYGIDHIIVTHAHDDHTAELEALLMLFQRRWSDPDLSKKCVNLYLSAGVQRKFAGLLDLRDPKYGKVFTLCPSTHQRIPLNDKVSLTVLPAFHDDVITRESAVGLGFEFDTPNGKRRVVFTGDSGFYPRKLSPDGEQMYYESEEKHRSAKSEKKNTKGKPEKKHPQLDTAPGRALFEQYPEEFKNAPHLVVAHIGSIKEQEFGSGEIPPPGEHGRRFYPNHLGLLGTLMLLNALHPDAAVISEFGAELKGFHIELVQKLGKALNKVQEKKEPSEKETFVIAGDLTTAYDITNHRLLGHVLDSNGLFQFFELEKLVCRKAKDYLHKPKWDEEVEVTEKNNSERAYLFLKDSKTDRDNFNAKHYAKHFFGRRLPYQTSPVTSEDEM